jgi:hydrogenase maturation protein HypF
MRNTHKISYTKIPLPLKIKKPILALGSQAKNTVCFAKGNFAYLSPIHPDLNNPKDFLNFKKDVKYFLKKNPIVIAADLHPEYQSTKYLLSSQLKTQNSRLIQHHHAHIVSCMLDNGLKEQKVIGVAFDGTGLGPDNALWGAEFLICDIKSFIRRAHLRQIPLLGGERAILEPWRLAVIWLYFLYKDKFLNLKLGLVKKIDRQKWRVLKKMYLSGFNSPLSSSMGRLFDAVASLVLEKTKVNFEAELAIALEKIAMGPGVGTSTSLSTNGERSRTIESLEYKFKINKKNGAYIIDPLEIFKQVISDLRNRVAKEKIAYRFHLTVAQVLRKTCSVLRKETGVNKVVLSGGVFQNKLLLNLGSDLLYKENFHVFTHKNLSCNDSGISLGQAVIANFGS